MSETIDEMISKIIEHESSKFTNTPGDAGGPTKFGISLRFVKGIPGPKFDLNHDGDTDADDVRLIDFDEASSLFKRYFYFEPKINTLPTLLQPMMFDECVNFGPVHAIQCLQKAVVVPADGRVGPATRLTVIETINRVGFPTTNNRIVDEFVARYERTAKAFPQDQKFLKGWLSRANSWRVNRV